MPCYSPLLGYWGVGRKLVFDPHQRVSDELAAVPCGQCIGCRLERSRQWAVRMMHEASLYDENCFITLTYSDEHLPVAGSLDRRAFPLFMKRLRKRFSDVRIRFFHCGEYGGATGRPHYHACLFGFDFPDKAPWAHRKGFPVFRSEALEQLWPFGQSEIGSVTFESAAYVARYITKKVTGEGAERHYQAVVESTGEVVDRVPEYVTMSRRPGIGRPWLDRFGCEVFPADSVVVRGKLAKPPRYYFDQFAAGAPVEAREVKRARARARHPEDETWERLKVREMVALAALQLKGERSG